MPKATLKLIGYIAAGVAALWAVWFVYDLLTASDKVKGRLGANQTDAAVESGSDAVETVGGQGASEDEIDDKVEGIGNDIDKADDPDGVDAAARDGLCFDFGICSEE